MRNHAPFCFTLSKDATRSESEPGNAFGRICGACCGACEGTVDAGRCAFGTTPGGTPCSLSAVGALTPGGNWGTWGCEGGSGEEPLDSGGADAPGNACAAWGIGECPAEVCWVVLDAAGAVPFASGCGGTCASDGDCCISS